MKHPRFFFYIFSYKSFITIVGTFHTKTHISNETPSKYFTIGPKFDTTGKQYTYIRFKTNYPTKNSH